MKKNVLVRTNILVCIIIFAGFLLTAVLSYQANYSSSLQNIEQVSSLTSEGIYYQLSAIFTKPVNISLTMAHDSLLIEYLSHESEHLEDENYIRMIKEYLNAYRQKYGYDSIFLASTGTGRYYNFNGLDRILVPEEPENVWFYGLLESDADYDLTVDNDEVMGANNDITVFVNCKIQDTDGSILGIVGVGLRIDYLQTLLSGYEDRFGVDAYLIDEKGTIQISTEYTGYEKMDLFETRGYPDLRTEILGWKEESRAKDVWKEKSDGKVYMVSRYIPELSWYLVVEQNTGLLVKQFREQLYRTLLIIAAIIVFILLIISYVIRGFNDQILRLTEERQEIFRKATEDLYDNIYELDITNNRAVGNSTQRYFESMGVPKNTPLDEALKLIAQRQIKEEFREGYLSTFCPENVLREYQNGNPHLRYDFMITQDGANYFWMRIDAHISFWPEEDSLRMFVYRKNIDEEKRRELAMEVQAQKDEMTGLYTKTATQQHIELLLAKEPKDMYAFFIIDIDNFKQANDCFGHAFGDTVIIGFADMIRQHFREEDLIGRIGGDEFAVFIPVPSDTWVKEKTRDLSGALNKLHTVGMDRWKITASIGVALSPRHGEDFETLYKHADSALYQTKKHGKNGYSIYDT